MLLKLLLRKNFSDSPHLMLLILLLHIHILLGCTPQAYKACTCWALRWKKEPRVSDGDISGLIGGGAYTSKARSWSDTPLCVADSRQDMVAIFAPGGNGRLLDIGGMTSGWLISYQGNQQRSTPLTTPLIRAIGSWSRGQICRKFSLVRRVKLKQAQIE